MTRRTTTHKWTFASRFRAGVFGWRASKLACQRVREAASEIRKARRSDPLLAAEGAVRLIEKLVPAIEHVDSSSGSLGNTVNKAVDALVEWISEAPAAADMRQAWLERLWQALQDDGFGYLDGLGDAWGRLCADGHTASRWADEFLPLVRLIWTESGPAGSMFAGTTACLSSLLTAGRYPELLELLVHEPHRMWHYQRYAVQALVEMGRPDDALAHAESCRHPHYDGHRIDRACEDILLAAGRTDDAYERFGPATVWAPTYLARYRELEARYPDRPTGTLLGDLIDSTPGEEGKWFAACVHAGHLPLALELAERGPCDPRTLTRAARDHLRDDPEFSRAAALAALRAIAKGWGYDLETRDVYDALDQMQAALKALDQEGELAEQVDGACQGAGGTEAEWVRRIATGARLPDELWRR